MLSRIVYRIVAVFFFLATILCVLCAVVCVIGMIARPDVQLMFYAVMFPILAAGMGDCCRSAWRAGRYDRFWHHYP